MSRFPILRARAGTYPFALWFSIGIALLVTAQIIDPGLVEASPTSVALPDWLEDVFRFTYAGGGWLAAWGILGGRPNAEAAGFSLLASGLAVQFVAILWLVAQGLIPADLLIGSSFIAFLAVGAILHAVKVAPEGLMDPFAAIVIALLGGGAFTGLALYRKAGPEAESITVASLTAALEQLNKELDRRDRRVVEQDTVIREQAREIAKQDLKINEQRNEMRTLRDRVDALERAIREPGPRGLQGERGETGAAGRDGRDSH